VNNLLTEFIELLCSVHWQRVLEARFTHLNSNSTDTVLERVLYSENRNRMRFIVIWTTSASKWRLRHRRVIESLFFHHPDALVLVYSNTLPSYFFHKFTSAGYEVLIIRYNISSIGKALPGSTWTEHISQWKKGKHFYAHLADYLRFVVLYKWGGVYTDLDSILLRPIDSTDMIGYDHCDQSNLDKCITLAENDSRKYYLAIGFMVLKQNHPLLRKALEYFDTMYNENEYSCGTIFITKAYAALKTELEENYSLTVHPPSVFYPIPWQDITQYSQRMNSTLWEHIKRTSVTLHVWGKVSTDQNLQVSSLLWNAFHEYSISYMSPEHEIANNIRL
jgi:hypothetical protein